MWHAQVRVLMYLGALCSGILEALADVEKAAVGALSTPRHRGKARQALRRLLRLPSKKAGDPEDAPEACSAAKKQAMQQTWMDMLSATNATCQNCEHPPQTQLHALCLQIR